MLFQDCFAVMFMSVTENVYQLTLLSSSVYLHLPFLFIVLSFVFEVPFFLGPFKTLFLLTAEAESRTAALPSSPKLTCEPLPR